MPAAQSRSVQRAALVMALAAGGAWAQPSADALLTKRSTELRESPGDASRSLAPLSQQTALTRLPARQGAWIQVRMSNGTTGWVHMFDTSAAAAPTPASNAATGALRGISNFFSRGSAQANSNSTTATVGIRGLSAEDIANAQPNLAALAKAETFRSDANQAHRFATEAALQVRAIDPLPQPSQPAPTSTSPNRYQLP